MNTKPLAKRWTHRPQLRRALAHLARLALVTVAGCATLPTTALVDGQEVPRKTLEFTGQPYTITHRAAHPRPGGPSSGLRDVGGNITGLICGMDVEYSVKHEGDRVQMVGFLDQTIATQLWVRDQHGLRTISGNLGGLAVNLTLTSSALKGQVGLRAFDLVQEGGALKGALVTTGTDPTNAVLNNRDQLWAMPAADQAVVLANLLTCFTANIGTFGRTPLEVGFGGPAGMQPRQSSMVYGGSRQNLNVVGR